MNDFLYHNMKLVVAVYNKAYPNVSMDSPKGRDSLDIVRKQIVADYYSDWVRAS